MKKRIWLFPLLLFVLATLFALGTAASTTPPRTVAVEDTAWGEDFTVTLPDGEGNYTYNTEAVTLKEGILGEDDVLVFTCRDDIPSGTHELLFLDGACVASFQLYEMGDVNMDGAITVRDAVLIKQAVIGTRDMTAAQAAYADVFTDGKLTVRDAVLLLQDIIGLDVELDDRVSVAFLDKDGSVYTSYSVRKLGALTVLPQLPIYEGYECAWDFTNIDLSAITRDVVVPCAATASPYTVTYHLDGGSHTGNPTTFTVESQTVTLADAYKAGYTFLGWYSDASFENRVTEIAEGTVGDLELYARFVGLDNYDALYIGANGEKTANGGHLLSLFGAFGGDVSVDLASGVWANKLGGKSATFGNHEQWERRDGGVGFTIFYGQLDADGNFVKDAPTNNVAQNGGANNSAKFLNTRLQFGLDLLPEEDFTIEYVAKYNPIYVADAEGNIALDADGNPEESYNYLTESSDRKGIDAYYAGAIDFIGFISSWTAKRDGIYSPQTPKRGDVIWMLSNKTPSWSSDTNWVGASAFSGGKGLLTSGIRDYGNLHTYAYTRDEVLTVANDGTRTVEATYSVIRDTLLYTSEKLSTANTKKGLEYFDQEETGDFYLSASLPTDFYGVRIYDTVLTTKELAHNAFVDMMAYAKFDLSKYNDLSEIDRVLIETGMMSYGFESDAAKFHANCDALKSFYADQPKAEDTLYVTDGLTVLTAGYAGLETGSLPIDGGLSWFNAAEKGTTITLKGAEWERRANEKNAGYYILKDYASTNANRDFGIFLGEEFLPEKDYTIELILNPVGIVAFEEDGSYTRYIDTGTRHGINYDNGFAIGPLRCLIFPSASDGEPGRSTLEKRWVYDRLDYCWNNAPDFNGDGILDRQKVFTENAWTLTQMNDIVNYTIDYKIDPLDGSGNYKVRNNAEVIGQATIAGDNIITNAEANNMFWLMRSMPHGVFSVRVYSRVLTQDEKLQNHVADIVYYYDLDANALKAVLAHYQDDTSVVFQQFASMHFDMSKEEAQTAFDMGLTALAVE